MLNVLNAPSCFIFAPIAALIVLAGCSTAELVVFEDNAVLSTQDVAAIQTTVSEAIDPTLIVAFRQLAAGRAKNIKFAKVCGIASAHNNETGKKRDYFFSGHMSGSSGTPIFRVEFLGKDDHANKSIRSECIVSGIDF